MKKPISVRLLVDAEEYLAGLDTRVKNKFLKSIQKTESGMKGQWFEPIKNSNGIWEFRQRDHLHFYRVFAFWDKSEMKDTLILATHGFYKKSNKTPPIEIRKAEIIRESYFKQKENNREIY